MQVVLKENNIEIKMVCQVQIWDEDFGNRIDELEVGDVKLVFSGDGVECWLVWRVFVERFLGVRYSQIVIGQVDFFQ